MYKWGYISDFTTSKYKHTGCEFDLHLLFFSDGKKKRGVGFAPNVSKIWRKMRDGEILWHILYVWTWKKNI